VSLLPRVLKDPLFQIGLAILLLIILISLAWRFYSPWTSKDIVGAPFQPPSIEHPLGTDDLGRDVMTLISEGVFITLFVGVASAILISIIGLLVGVTAAVLRGIVDTVLMRVVDFLLSIPSLVIALILVAMLKPSIFNVILVIAIIGWPASARLVRAYTLSLIEAPYVEASRALGAGITHVVVRHLIPNIIPIILGSILIGSRAAILLESGLSFLGLGDLERVSLGTILFYARRSAALVSGAYWLIVFPGLLIMLIILALTLITLAIERNLKVKE
jgi:ABC-type dipeptide/oligopeptide/nickel transport systems, permease components